MLMSTLISVTSHTMQSGELVNCLTQVALVLQEALDADDHPDMLDFSDHADGLQRTDSDVAHRQTGTGTPTQSSHK